MAYQCGCPWEEDICEIAALEGHLDCLRYAHENGCPWGATCRAAVMSGSLCCLKYAIEKGCFVDVRALYLSMTSQLIDRNVHHKHCIEYVTKTKMNELHNDHKDWEAYEVQILESTLRRFYFSRLFTNKYIKNRAINKMNKIRQELIIRTWHPRRLKDWCLDEEEKKEIYGTMA
jgi:hypothetical protein